MGMKVALLAAACVCALLPEAVAAQQTTTSANAPQNADASNTLGEVIVTARKRQESILNVPVVETAIPQAQLERFQTVDLKDVATMVPGLALGDQVLSIGTQISLRGVGTSTLDAGVDQSVSLNLDGLQLSNGLAYSSGLFDIGQVEVLKGPQALFYGKNSPGGVVSLRTADPTNQVEVIGRYAHEFYANENRGELIVSGPVNDQLRLRLAAAYDKQDGDFTNDAIPDPGTGAKAPAFHDVFPDETYILRGTAIWRPRPFFDARLKANYTHDRVDGGPMEQLTSCPDGVGPVPGYGIPFEGGGEDCKKDHVIRVVDLDPAAFPGVYNNGTPFLDTDQKFGTLEMNFYLRPDVTLTSTTGYYNLTSTSMINGTETNYAGATLGAENNFYRHELTEELRANSDFSGPLNFSAGTFFLTGRVQNIINLMGNIDYGLPATLAHGQHNLEIDSQSVFGQLRYKIIPRVELAAGARYTHETRSDHPYNYDGNSLIPVNLAVPEIRSYDLSPEATLTWRPTDDVTLFGSVKKGFKSGSFTITTPVFNGSDNAFGDEKVKGGEVGAKARLLDRQIFMNIAFYDYRYTGLQVGANSVAQGGLPVETTVNAGSALVHGIDFDASYHPRQIARLELHTGVEANHARFQSLNNVPCYGGQTIAAGCNQLLNPATGLYTSQDLAGLPLIRAPDWQVNWGASYETPSFRNMSVIFASDTQYSSRYLTNLGNRPDYYQSSFFKTDASATLKGPGDHWELAVIGKNLADTLTSGTCTNLNHANGQILGGEITGGTGVGPAGTDELTCFVDRGREVWLRVTYKPFS